MVKNAFSKMQTTPWAGVNGNSVLNQYRFGTKSLTYFNDGVGEGRARLIFNSQARTTNISS